MVRVEGLEPPWIAPPDPKSGMSTNFTTPACTGKADTQPKGAENRLTIEKGVQIYRLLARMEGKFKNNLKIK